MSSRSRRIFELAIGEKYCQMLRNRQLIEICEVLAEQEDLKVTYRLAIRDAVIIILGAYVGGILAGRLGIAIGGSLTSILRAFINRGKYKSVVEIIKYDLTPKQKRKLIKSIKKAIRNVSIEDVTNLMSIITNVTLKELILNEIVSFLSRELNLAVVSK